MDDSDEVFFGSVERRAIKAALRVIVAALARQDAFLPRRIETEIRRDAADFAAICEDAATAEYATEISRDVIRDLLGDLRH